MSSNLIDVSSLPEVVYRKTSEGLLCFSNTSYPHDSPEDIDAVCPCHNENTHLFEIVASLVLEEAQSLAPSPGILPAPPDEMRVYTLNSANPGTGVLLMLQLISDCLMYTSYRHCRYLILGDTLIISGTKYSESIWFVILCSDPGKVKYLPSTQPAELENYGDVAGTGITFYTGGPTGDLVQNTVECLFYSGRSAVLSENPLIKLTETSGYSHLDSDFFCTPALWDKPVSLWLDILSEAFKRIPTVAEALPRSTTPEEYVNVLLKAVKRLVPGHIQRLILREISNGDSIDNYNFERVIKNLTVLMPGNTSMLLKYLPANLQFCTFSGVVPGVYGMSPERMELTVRYRYTPPFLDTSEMCPAEKYTVLRSIADENASKAPFVTVQLDKGEKISLCYSRQQVIRNSDIPFHCETADGILTVPGIKRDAWNEWYTMCRKYRDKPVQDPSEVCEMLDMLKLKCDSGSDLSEIIKYWLKVMAKRKAMPNISGIAGGSTADERTLAEAVDGALNSYFTHRGYGVISIGAVVTLDPAYLHSLLALTISHITMAEYRRNSELTVKLTNYYKRRKRHD